jgi:hypothetical protein
MSVRIPIQVFLPSLETPITAMNQDISWGGAQFVASFPVAEMSGILRLVFPWTAGHKIAVEAEVVRAQRLQGGHCQVAVRFASLSPRSQARLEKLLTMLDVSDGVSDGTSGDLVRELEVRVEGVAAMRDILEQVRTGTLTVAVLDAYEPNPSVRLVIRGSDDLPRLRLRARVNEVAQVKAEGFSPGNVFSLKLGFEHPQATIAALAELLIHELPPVWKDPQSSFASAPEWLRSMHLARPSEDLQVSRASDVSALSALESRFPMALAALIAAWGDAEDFDRCFRDLTLGDHAEPGGWPADVWEELGFLQDAHDLAYGLPSNRQSALRPTRCR